MTVDLRLAVPVAAAWIVLAVVIALPRLLFGAAVALWVAAIVATAVAVVVRSRAHGFVVAVSIALAATALLVSAAAARQPERQPDFLLQAAHSGRFVTALAETTQTVHPEQDRFRATLHSVSVGSRSYSADIPVLVFAASATTGNSPDGPVESGIGTTVRLSGTLQATDSTEDVAFLFFAAHAPPVIDGAPWFLDWANSLRAGFRAAAEQLPGEGGDLLPGLAVGDTSAVGSSLDTAMKSTSLSHLTAVSGANCAVVIALIMLAGAAMGIPRGLRVAGSVCTLVGFVVLVTPEPSVLRAAVMATLVLGALVAGRPLRGVPTLALATLVLLVIDPWLSRSYGFVLSVLATGGLLVLSAPLARALSRWLPRWIAMLVAIPLAAQLACQPVLVLLNPSIPTYGVVANVLAEPAAPIATVLGLAACILLSVLPALGQFVAQLAWLPSSWIAAVAGFFAGLPGSSIPWPAGAFGVAVTIVITVLALVVFLLGGHSRADIRLRRVAAAGLTLILVGSLGIASGDAVRVQLSRPSDWQIAACDIGQGDAVIVRSLGQVALIDTGPDPALLRACLDTLGVARIDLLVLSHWDTDHVGGTSAVFGRVARAMIGPTDGSPSARLGQQLAEHGAAVSQVAQGVTGMLGDLGWEVLWPRARLAGVEPGNDASVTIRFSAAGQCLAGCLSAIFLGDLGDRPQALMMAANRIGRVDVVKVAHHGSADQNPRLYQKLAATVGVISVGLENDYGHPTDMLLGILADSSTLATRTDVEGLTLVSPRPDGTVSVWTEHPMPRSKLLSH